MLNRTNHTEVIYGTICDIADSRPAGAGGGAASAAAHEVHLQTADPFRLRLSLPVAAEQHRRLHGDFLPHQRRHCAYRRNSGPAGHRHSGTAGGVAVGGGTICPNGHSDVYDKATIERVLRNVIDN